MTSAIFTKISKGLYELILSEKKDMIACEQSKVKSRRKRVTMITASQNLVRKLR